MIRNPSPNLVTITRFLLIKKVVPGFAPGWSEFVEPLVNHCVVGCATAGVGLGIGVGSAAMQALHKRRKSKSFFIGCDIAVEH